MDRQLVSGFSHIMQNAARGEERISRKVMLRQNDVLCGIANVTEKAVAPIIERRSEPRASRKQFKSLLHRIETEIISGNDQRLCLRCVSWTN